MPPIDRRSPLLASAAAPVALAGFQPPGAARATEPVPPPAKPPEVTRLLAHYITTARYDDLPANVRKEGVRTLLNWPLVLELTGKPAPQSGLEGKFSIYHAVAVALVEGAGGEKQFSDRAVRDPVIVALRAKVMPVVDATIKPEQVDLTIQLKGGRSLHKFIEHTIGSLEVPMSDQVLERKFTDLADGILPSDQARHVMDLCWQLETLPNAAEIAKGAAAA